MVGEEKESWVATINKMAMRARTIHVLMAGLVLFKFPQFSRTFN
jgi:hypothetical protein